MPRDVAPDGSPVPVYRAMPPEPEFSPLLRHMVEGASVLDLGCGTGRLANELARRGADVTGVDQSQSMLDHLAPQVRAVPADIEGLSLGRRFRHVILASHLINVADAATRHAFLLAAADHVEPAGTVAIQHWECPPAAPQDSEARVDGVHIRFRVLELDGKDLRGQVTYELATRVWVQQFHARLLDESDLDRELRAAGLNRRVRLSPKWLIASPAEPAG